MNSYVKLALSLAQSSDEDLMEFMSESAIMMAFDHPNVLNLLGVCLETEDNLPIIILPYMANGDLKSFLVSSRNTVNNTELPEVYMSVHVICPLEGANDKFMVLYRV